MRISLIFGFGRTKLAISNDLRLSQPWDASRIKPNIQGQEIEIKWSRSGALASAGFTRE